MIPHPPFLRFSLLFSVFFFTRRVRADWNWALFFFFLCRIMTRNTNRWSLREREKSAFFVLQSERRKKTFSPPSSHLLPSPLSFLPFFYLLKPFPPPRDVSSSVAFFFLRGTEEPWEGFIAL